MNNQKKLSIAFYWHMHQPVYELEGTYLMPWVRLHAIKDYLDMVLVLERFPQLKLNFDIVPALLDSIIDYTKGFQDIHFELSSYDVNNLSDEEKSFIINNFFSAKFETMVFKNETYRQLYQKRFSIENFGINDFSLQEYSDLMAVFNLVWIDPVHYERYPRLQDLWDKKNNYTQEDRLEILDIQLQIMSEIIPTYKKFVQEGRIELTTSPYYHPILPILIDIKSASKECAETKGLPVSLGTIKDAVFQISSAGDRIEELFGIRPKGLWAPELCLGTKTLNIIANEGFEWTISDEGILSSSINFNFIRDFKGNLNDPYKLLKTYTYHTKNEKNIDIIFRDRSIPNLINFEYAGINPEMAANDLYEKIKTIQNKLLVSPDESHLLTIASDCENCWENYQNDGRDFLDKMYALIENDETLETVLISDYIKNDKHKKTLKKIYPGSWIDKTFKYWIGDSEKNIAWDYLKKTKDDLVKFMKSNKGHSGIEKAKRDLVIAEGSDWFWWYGKPNNSGQDFLFDYMFRERLKNVYGVLGVKYPEYLDKTIISSIELPFRYPKRQISPKMDGLESSSGEWYNAGSMSLIDGPVFRENKNVDKIDFGCDNDNIYFRLHVNKNASERSFIDRINQFYIYIRNSSRFSERAHIRLICKTDNPYPILTEKFEHEIAITLVKDTLYPIRYTTVLHSDIWTLDNPEGLSIIYKDVIDLCIPFDKLGVKNGETVEFFMANTDSGVKNTYIPQEVLLSFTRQ